MQRKCRQSLQCNLMQVEAAAAAKSTAERQGKTVESLPDDSLFFIDKVDHLPTEWPFDLSIGVLHSDAIKAAVLLFIISCPARRPRLNLNSQNPGSRGLRRRS